MIKPISPPVGYMPSRFIPQVFREGAIVRKKEGGFKLEISEVGWYNSKLRHLDTGIEFWISRAMLERDYKVVG